MDVHVDRITQPSSRAQFGEPVGALVVDGVLSANLDAAPGAVAPGSIISIFGRNLAAVRGDLSGWEGERLPESLNGVTVDLGPLRSFPIFVSPTQINAVLPFEAQSGSQQLAVRNGTGISPEVTVRVANVAPAIFAGAIVRLSDASLVTSMNPARSGEMIRIYLTGLGQTNPPLTSGLVVREPRAVQMPVVALFGDQRVEVDASTAAPGIPGLYQLDVRVPRIASGAVRLLISAGNVTSTPVMIPVR